jgi:tetratricopeptide (TPR) repeat protein
MELDGSPARSGEWPALVEDESAPRTVSPRALLARGPITRPARPKRATTPAADPDHAPAGLVGHAVEAAPAMPALPKHALLYWRAGVVAVMATVAASLLIVANGPTEPELADEPIAAVGAASPETATALQAKPAPVAADVVAEENEAFAEEVLFIEDDLDDEPVEPAPVARSGLVDAEGAARSASRARARDAARVLTGRARTRRAAGDIANAEKLLGDALEALPTYAPAAADLATIHIHRGDYRRALSYAKQAQRSAPRKLGYMVLLGDAHQLNGNGSAAGVWWRRAAEYGSTKAEERLAKHGPR